MRSSYRTAVRAAGVAGTAAVMLVAGSAGALAHECYVASRSDQGNAMAGTHSAAWQTVSLEFIVTNILGQTDPAVVSCTLPAAAAAGIPSSFVFGDKQATGQDHVIAENNPNMEAKGLSSNGTGIDHAADVYGGQIVGIIIGCGGTPPG